MTTAAKSYRKAVNALRPNRAKLKAIHEEARISANAARDSVRQDLAAGADAQTLYHAETDKDRRVVLVGVLRRGLSALDHD